MRVSRNKGASGFASFDKTNSIKSKLMHQTLQNIGCGVDQNNNALAHTTEIMKSNQNLQNNYASKNSVNLFSKSNKSLDSTSN